MGETIITATATVDDLIGGGLQAPDLMKIDVEQAEHLVLAGATACLNKNRQYWFWKLRIRKFCESLTS